MDLWIRFRHSRIVLDFNWATVLRREPTTLQRAARRRRTKMRGVRLPCVERIIRTPTPR